MCPFHSQSLVPALSFAIIVAAAISLAAVGCERRDASAVSRDSRTPTDSKTPMDQSETSANIRVTADIRKAILDDKTMSVNAQNCKVITDAAGVVTLRGVVNSQAEKDAVGAIAKAVAGVTRVENLLEVKTN